MRGLIFVSENTRAVYLWNGSDVVCIKGNETVHFGRKVEYFRNVDFKLLLKNANKPKIKAGLGFEIGRVNYKILYKLKLDAVFHFKYECIISV